MKRTVFIAGTAAFAAVCAAASGQSALKPLRVGIAEGDDATFPLYAQKAGLFAKYGLDVTLVTMSSGSASIAALAGGSVDVAGSSLLPFIEAHNSGLPLQIVAPEASYNPDVVYAALLVKKDAPIKSGKDLNGKTIASPALKDLNWIATMAWIDANGGDSSTVKSVELVSSAIPAAIEEGRVDAATVTTPRYVQAIKTRDVRMLGKSYESIAKHFLFAVFAAQTDYAAKNAELIQNFGRAIRESTIYCNGHHAETLDLSATFTKIDPKLLADAPRAVNTEYVDPKDLQPVIAVATKFGILTKAIDPQSLIAPSILKPGM